MPFKTLIISDFDQTIAETFKPSPSGKGVKEAYHHAIEQVFGTNGVSYYYDELGGLKNREPSELTQLIAQGVGLYLSRQELEQVTTQLVEAKIAFLQNEISSAWPKLIPGVKDFFQAVENGEIDVQVAILSSGHTEVINKVFRCHELTPPRILVTSDTIRALKEPPRPKYKPHPFPVALVHKEWLKLNESSSYGPNSYLYRSQGKPHMMYLGDDPIKDGELAENSRIIFGFVPYGEFIFAPDATKGQLLIPDFNFLLNMLKTKDTMLKEGKPLSEVIFGIPDHELFPPVSEAYPGRKFVENDCRHRIKERL